MHPSDALDLTGVRRVRIRNGHAVLDGAVTGELDVGGSATAYRAVSLLHDRTLVLGQPGRGVYVAGQE